MKKKGQTKRQRIIIYYVLAIVLPCLILGILALRGIKNDQALVEREQRRNLLEAGQQLDLRKNLKKTLQNQNILKVSEILVTGLLP